MFSASTGRPSAYASRIDIGAFSYHLGWQHHGTAPDYNLLPKLAPGSPADQLMLA